MPKSQNQYGSGTLTADLSATGDYFDHNSNIYTTSPRTDPNLYATALTNSPDVIRGDKMSYVSTAVIGGCAYYRQPGYLMRHRPGRLRPHRPHAQEGGLRRVPLPVHGPRRGLGAHQGPLGHHDPQCRP